MRVVLKVLGGGIWIRLSGLGKSLVLGMCLDTDERLGFVGLR